MYKQLLRLPSVLARTGVSRASWYAAVKKGLAPGPVKLSGGRAAAWVSTEIDAYIDRQISARDGARSVIPPKKDDARTDATLGHTHLSLAKPRRRP